MRRVSIRPLLVAALAFFAWRTSIGAFGGRGQLHEQSSGALAGLFGNEAIFYVAVSLAQLFVVGGIATWLAGRWSRARLDAIARRVLDGDRASLAAIALAGAAATLLVAVFAARLHTTSEDEKTYLFQAKLLLLGRFRVAVPSEAGPLWEPFLVRVGNAWSGQYFWAQPALLALGLMLRGPHVVCAAEVACGAYFTGLLARELTGDRRAAILAAVVAASSPIAVLTGATLLNASLSLACAAVTLWALARLHAGPSEAAAWALGLATGINLHNRVLDQAALVGAATCVLAVAHFRRPWPLAKRLLPAIAITLPFLALHPLLNRLVSGDWRQSGYALYYAGNPGIKTFGFGAGMGSFNNDVPTAFSKTIANAVRMAFYTSGGPFVFAPLAAWAIGMGRVGGALRAGAWITFVYFATYLLYTSSPIQTTGPVYFDAIVPVLAASIAIGAARLHDAIRDREALRRVVPSLVVAHLAGAFALFWPTATGELAASANDSAACEDLVAASLGPAARAIVFVTSGSAHRSWTWWKPMPSPRLDDRVLYANVDGPAADVALVDCFGAGRGVYLARCVAEPKPRLDRFDPKTGATTPLDR